MVLSEHRKASEFIKGCVHKFFLVIRFQNNIIDINKPCLYNISLAQQVQLYSLLAHISDINFVYTHNYNALCTMYNCCGSHVNREMQSVKTTNKIKKFY